MKELNTIDFTIAVAPNSMSIEQDMLFVKSALLYSDTINLVSPMASIYFKLTDKANNRNERTLSNLLKEVIPYCENFDPLYCNNAKQIIKQFDDIVNSKKYKSVPFIVKNTTRQGLQKFSNEIKLVLEKNLGEINCQSLTKLVESKKVELYDFKNSIVKDDAYIDEYYNILKQSVSNARTFPLFDDLSNSLIQSAIKEGIIILNNSDEFEVKHANLTNNLLVALPSFEFASIDEILDIRKELEAPLIRFRSRLLSFDNEIQSMPWDDDFQIECKKIYLREVAPSVLEIDELTKDSSFIKNLGYSFLTDESALKNTGQLVVTVAMAGAITAFSDVMSSEQAFIATGGAYAASKVAAAFKEHKDKQREITSKDMYFYYRAGKLLDKDKR